MQTTWWVILILFLFGCGPSSDKAPRMAIDTSPQVDVMAPVSSTMAFRKTAIKDSLTNLNAITCIVPDGWDVKTNAFWVHTDYIEPFKYHLIVTDTDTINRIEVFPSLSYFTSSEKNVPKIVDNSHYKELRYSNELPNSAVDAIQDYLIPTFRPYIYDLRIKEYIPLNSLDATDEYGRPQNKETGLVRIRYNLNNIMVEEIFFATFSKEMIPVDKYNTHCIWHVESAFSCRAHQNYLDDQLRNLQTLVGSMYYEYSWLLKYNGALSTIREMKKDSLTENELIDIVSRSTTNHAEAGDIFQTFQRHMWRHALTYNRYQPMLQSYIDISDNVIQLPQGYVIAWKSDKERYVLADSVGYKPKSNGTEAWYELKPNESAQEFFPAVSGNVVFD